MGEETRWYCWATQRWVGMSQARGGKARTGQGGAIPQSNEKREKGQNETKATEPDWSHRKDLASTRYKAVTVETMSARQEGRQT